MRRLTLAVLAALALLASACGDDAEPTAGAAEAPAATTTTEAPAPTTTEAVTDCPADDFLLEVNDVVRDDGYADPELAVACADTTFTVTGNGMIAYEFVPITPNDLQETVIDVQLPLEPTEAAVPGAIGLGAMGVSVNGVALYAAFEAPQMDYGDPVTDGLLDACNGHTSPAEYHYHARATCLFDDPDEPGLVYGYAFDGYPIVAPFECTADGCTETEEVTSSYVRVDESTNSAFDGWAYEEGAGDLDACNGRVDGDGEYRYYVTDQFPYLPFCFHGETDAAQGDFTGEAPADAGPPGAGAGPPV
jgi:hypothetical protein